MKSEKIGISQLVFAQVVIAFIYVIVKLSNDFGIYNLAFFRVLLACFFIGLLFIYFKKFKLVAFKTQKIRLILFGILHAALIIASFVSINNLSVALAVLLSSTITIWMVIFSSLLLKEKITKRVVISVIVSFIGLLIILNYNDFYSNTKFIGILAGLFVGVAGGFVYTLSKTFRKYNGVSLAFWQNLIAIPFLIPFLFFKIPIFNLYNIGLLIATGVVGALSFILLYLGFQRVKGQIGAVLSLLNVPFTILAGFIFFLTVPSFREIIGGILIVFGAYFASTK